MRTHPEDTDKAHMRAELRKKPISTAQTKHLKKSFLNNASLGQVELAHTALNLLPQKEQDKLEMRHINMERKMINNNSISKH